MARRKDHTRKELKGLILEQAQKIIFSKGLEKLTARNLAQAIGYAPGTIYNVFRDLDTIILSVNLQTLIQLEEACRKNLSANDKSEKAAWILAHSYVDFAQAHRQAWSALFSYQYPANRKLPDWYTQQVERLFQLIADTVQENYGLSKEQSNLSARVLWGSLHGLCSLTVHGKLESLTGISLQDQVDFLLGRFFTSAKN
jgi:AcrR family transcriptional regulator